MKEGNLTAFNYYPTTQKSKLFASLLGIREMPFCYIPVSEAKAWRKELEERALSQGRITAKELEEARKKGDWVYQILAHGNITLEELQGLKPDTGGFFLEWDSKWHKGQKAKKAVSK